MTDYHRALCDAANPKSQDEPSALANMIAMLGLILFLTMAYLTKP